MGEKKSKPIILIRKITGKFDFIEIRQMYRDMAVANKVHKQQVIIYTWALSGAHKRKERATLNLHS